MPKPSAFACPCRTQANEAPTPNTDKQETPKGETQIARKRFLVNIGNYRKEFCSARHYCDESVMASTSTLWVLALPCNVMPMIVCCSVLCSRRASSSGMDQLATAAILGNLQDTRLLHLSANRMRFCSSCRVKLSRWVCCLVLCTQSQNLLIHKSPVLLCLRRFRAC